VFGEPTTGAESDIQQLTTIARQMVGRWGMSAAIGPLSVLPPESAGPYLPGVSEVSAHTQEQIDEESRTIVEAAYREVIDLLGDHRAQLDALASALLEHETLDEDAAYAAAGVPHDPSAAATANAQSANGRDGTGPTTPAADGS
jgi:cell division protease FtsH